MGFDNECIINIQSLAGEYFCPVCRTLVYPNEALQSQCTHLYCKPCLAYVVGTTKACPYDGYLVTEADSKPLTESNKALAETIGKIVVHCLYHRSGCTWQGPLSECTSHCSGCAFGNSPVVCNRCAVQIVHRQVQEHAQNCPGANPQAQQVSESSQDAATSGTSAAAANPNQSGTQPASHAQISQTAAAPPPAQDPNQQANGNPQAQVVAPVAAPTTEQWYQQQYQQYYQQYPGYDPYQQYQQYYPYQQQATPQLQQPPYVQGQQQPQVYNQPQAQLQAQHLPHSQPQLQSQVQAQPQNQPQLPLQPQPQPQPQPQLQQSQPQLPIPPHGQPQPYPYVQTPVNPQQQLHPGMQPHAQVQSQNPPAHGHVPPQAQPYPQSQPHSVQPHTQQHMQVPQYQQPHQQVHQPQLQIQAQPHSQAHPPTQPHSQTHPQMLGQNQPQPHPPLHPQPNQLPVHNSQPPSQQPSSHAVSGHHSYSQVQGQQQVQTGVPQQHAMHMHPPIGSLTPAQAHGQYPQPPSQTRPPQPHVLMPNQQQPTLPPSHSQFPSNLPQHHQIRPLAQQQVNPVNQHPVMQLIQQQSLQQYGQPPFPGQASGPIQGSSHQHAPFAQQPMQAQSRPQGPPHPLHQSSPSLPQPPHAHGMPSHHSQNYVGRPVAPNNAAQSQPFPQSPAAFGIASQHRPMQLGSSQSSGHQNYANMANNQQNMSSEPQFIQSGLQVKNSMVESKGDLLSERSTVDQESGSASQKSAAKDDGGVVADSVMVQTLKSESAVKSIDGERKALSEGGDIGKQDDTNGKDAGAEVDEVKDSAGEPVVKKMVEEISNGNLDASSGRKPVEVAALGEKDVITVTPKQLEYISVDDRQAKVTLPKEAVDGSTPEKKLSQGRLTHQGPGIDQFGGFEGKGFMHSSHPVSLTDQGRHQLPPMPYGPTSHQQRSAVVPMVQSGPLPGPPPNALIPGQPPVHLRPEGAGRLPPPRLASHPPEQYQQPSSFHPDFPFGGPPAPGSTASFGRGPGQFGAEGPWRPNPVDNEMFINQRPRQVDGRHPDSHMSGSLERGQFGQPYNVESNMPRMNGVPGLDSAPGMRDGGFKTPNEERLNPYPIGQSRGLDQGLFGEVSKQFPIPSHMGTDASPKFGSSFSSSRPIDMPPREFNYDGGGAPSRFLPPYQHAGERQPPFGLHEGSRGRGDSTRAHPDLVGADPEFGRHQMDRLTPRSPGREYLGGPRGFGSLSGGPRSQSGIDNIDGRENLPFGEGSRSFNLSADPVGNSFRDSRFPVLPGQMRRGEFDGPENFRIGDHFRSGDMMGQDFMANNLQRGDILGPRNIPSHLHVGDPTVFGTFPVPTESFGGNKSNHPRLGEPGFRSSYSLQGFPTDGGFYAGNVDSFDRLRKRKPTSMGWCRICKVDCESVEGLDLHAQTREHQKMTMDLVISIKQQNAKKQKASKDHSSAEEGSRARNTGSRGRGKKP